MDLEKDQDADVMVLVPLSDQEFAWRARQLERGPAIPKDAYGLGRLLHIDRLALRLYPTPASPGLDTDTAAWRDIWDQAVDGEILFVRRPPRTAETNVSAVVLARGFDLPDPAEGLPPDLEDLETQLDAAQEALDTAQSEADDLRRRLAELEAQTVDERIAILQAQVADLQRQLAAAQRDAQALAKAQERIRTLTAQIRDLETAVAAARAERNDLAEERDALATERDALREALADCQAQLESGTQPPSVGTGLPDSLTVSGLARMRTAGRTTILVVPRLEAALADRPADQIAVAEIFVMVERRYDPALWGTLATLATDRGGIVRFRDGLLELVAPDMPVEKVVAQIGGGLGLSAAQIDAWQRLAG
jgi:regulator of replication initiation timing